jgi:dTDP-4-amino-4,6-dideoxygalactose transaminase
MNEPDFLVFAAPDIQDPEIAEVEACMRSEWLGTGPRVATRITCTPFKSPLSPKLSHADVERAIAATRRILCVAR